MTSLEIVQAIVVLDELERMERVDAMARTAERGRQAALERRRRGR